MAPALLTALWLNTTAWASPQRGPTGLAPALCPPHGLREEAAVVQSISLTLHGEPVKPMVLREWLASTGQPQPGSDSSRVGPPTDLRAVIRTFLAP